MKDIDYSIKGPKDAYKAHPQFCNDVKYGGEYVTGQTHKGSGPYESITKHIHKFGLAHKIIDSTKRTERDNNAPPVSKAFSTMAKSGYYAYPNSIGNKIK